MCAIILSRDTYKRKDGINLAGGRRFQAGLGSEHKRLYKEGQQINTLLLAQVIQVNYKYNTVDLLALQHKEVFQNSYANEGRFSARLPMEFGGRNLAGQPYGQVNPIAVGTVVLVGFINSDKDMPIVISVYNNNDVNKQLSRTRFANAEPTDMALAGQMYQKFSLYPSLTYDSIDGDGNRIVTFSGKSFIAFDTKDMQNSPMTDASYGSRYEDLGTSYYNDGELIEPMKGRAPNVLFKHQGILDDDNKPDTHNFMIHINPDGTYRTSMMDTEQDWRTMFEMTPEGKIRLRRQGDTVRLNDGFEIGELGINEEGIVYLRNGGMDLEVREDGIYSQGKLISESVNLDDIYEKLANATFEINKTNKSLQILAGKSEVQDGKIVNLETEITIVAGKVESKVSATEVQDMIDSSIVDMAEAIKQAQEDADRANQIISDMASDNRLTPSEKLDLLKEWDIVKNEYPTYLAQAELYEVDSTTYTAKYKALETFVTPLLEDMEATSVVDGSIMRKTFSAYYTERINLLNAITKGLKDGLEEAMKKASQASVDATQALADSAQAQIDANNAKQLIADIASDGKLTASEKYQLKKEWDVIVKEYPTTIAQATKYKVNTDNYTAKYKALETFVTPLFANMNETSVVNGEQLRAVFSDYYAVKITLLKEITDIARDELTDYGNRITVAETKITQTSEAITLMASRVETVESNVKTNTAQLKVQADLISQKVTASEVKDAIDNAIDNMSIGGSNLFVIKTQTAGLLNENNGTVGTAVDKSVVSNYIKVTAKMPYVASLYGNTGTNSIIIAWYDTSKAFISGQAVADSGDFHKTYVAPENAVYARLSYKKSDTVKMKFEVGTKPTDYSPSWDDIKGDQTALEEYIKQVEEQAKQAQQEAENAKNEAENANSVIADMSNDNMLTANEKQQILLQWEEIKTEYSINLDQANKFNVSTTQYTTAYNALKSYLDPLLADITKTSVIIGSTMRSTFNTYYDRRTTLLNRVAELAKQVADQAKNTADKVDDDLNNIGGYNYIGFSSGDHMYPRLMIKNVGYYYIPSTTSAEFAGDMVCLKPKTATVTNIQYDVGNANASVADVGLANYRMKEVKTGQWLTASANLKVVGIGTAYLTIFTLENGSWKASYSDRVSASQGVTRVVAQRQVTDATTGILLRVEGTNVSEVHFGNAQLEVGIRSTPWKKSDIDIQEDINNVADKLSDDIKEVQDNANKAQADATKAQSDATKANQAIADLSNDNLATPNEKLDLKKEWETIVAEKPKNDAQADKFGVSKVAYGTAYTALDTYLKPILASLTTNSAIVGQTMRDTFKAYYTARTDLLNAVATKAKDLADTAQSGVEQVKAKAEKAQADATKAQQDASKAQQDATKANQAITDLSNDNLVTPNEKLDLKKEWEIIVAEKPKNDAQADKFGVNKTTYGTAYNALNTYLTPILANLTTNSAIVGQTMRDTFKTYYSARTDLLNAIASKAKDLADNAQNTADNIAVGTRNLLVGTKDFSKGKYPGNTHVTIANEKFNDNAVLKNDPTSISGVYSDMYQITTSIVPSATQYTLSFYAKADVAGVKMNCYFYNPNTSTKVETNQGYNRTSTDGSAEFTLSTKWEKYWVVWTQATPPDVIKSIIIGRLSKGTSPLSPIYMSSPMMVEGNKAQTWMKAPEDVETAINGKEGAWVYSPTAPTNPAIGLVWVDSSKTPNQPKRWVGGETGWVALTPEEVKDLPWGEDGSNLADWVAQAEQKISSDAIINTVLGSEDFTGIFDKKANTEDLNNLASYDDLDAMQAEYERLLKEGIAGIDFSPYVTNTELEQLKDSFTFSVQQAGGVNMLKNSLGFSGLDFWDDDSGRNFYRKNNSVTVTNPNVKFERTDDTPNGFKLTGAQDRNGTVRINNVINSNGYWTVSFWLRGSQSGTSNFQMDICDLGVTNFAVTADNDWRKVSLTVNVTNYNQSTHHFVDFQNIAWAYFFIKDFKVEKGITATDWTPAPEDAIVFDPIVTTTQNDQLAKLGFGSGFMVNRAQNAILRQTIELPEAKQGLQYALSFYMNVATFGDTTGLQCGARIYEEGVLKYTVGVTDATQGIPSDYHLYKLVFEPESPNTVIELFVINGAQATVIISGVMYNIGNIALKWQPYPSEIYNTNVKIDINGITVKNNQTDGYTMITPQEFSGYARVNGEMERIFTLNGQVTEVKMLKAEKRITMEPISVFAMNSKETNTIGWAFVASGDASHTTVPNT